MIFERNKGLFLNFIYINILKNKSYKSLILNSEKLNNFKILKNFLFLLKNSYSIYHYY